MVHQADLMATFADIVDQRLPENAGEDSFSLVPLLQGEDRDVRETAVSQSMRGLLAIRRGPWKLIFGTGSGGWTPGQDAHPAQLYNLDDDLPESRNLYADRAEIVTQLNELMKDLVHHGRSTPGSAQSNDVPVRWHSLR
jgi:arylsulfatase A-like enzyme